MKFAEDPVDRYRRLTASASTELSPDSLAQVMAADETDETKLVDHVARHSRLTAAEASAVVATALQTAGSTQAKAKAVSSAVSAAAINGGVELSDPVMLDPPVRLAFAIVFCVVVAGCVAGLDDLGRRSASPDAALIGLAVVGVVAIVAVLVLVMGYKNVKITGSSGK